MMFTVVLVESIGENRGRLARNARLLKNPRPAARVMRRKCCLQALKNLPVLKSFYPATSQQMLRARCEEAHSHERQTGSTRTDISASPAWGEVEAARSSRRGVL
jgi:hypothetical protein